MQSQQNRISEFTALFDRYDNITYAKNIGGVLEVLIYKFTGLEVANEFFQSLIDLTDPKCFISETHTLARDASYNHLAYVENPSLLVGPIDRLALCLDGNGDLTLTLTRTSDNVSFSITMCCYLKDTDVKEGDIITIDPGHYDPKTTECFTATRDFKMSELTALFNSEYEQNHEDYREVALASGLVVVAPRKHTITVCNYDGTHVERSGEHTVEFYIDGPDGKSVNQITIDYEGPA